MVKQKIMYLLCLLMFAVGINAQHIDGTVDNATGTYTGRQAVLTSQTSSYNPTPSPGEVTYTFLINGRNTTSSQAQVVSITGSNMNITSVTINGNSATKSSLSGQADATGETAEVYYIANTTKTFTGGFIRIEIKARPVSTTQNVTLNGMYTWQTDGQSAKAAAGHLDNPIATVYNWLGINGTSHKVQPADTTKPTIAASDIIVYRGEQVSNKTMTVSDDKGLKTITVSNSPAVEGTFTIPTINGQTSETVTLKLSDAGGLVPLNKGRVTQGLINDINRERETSHTITATDNANNTQTATFKVIVRTQTQAYTASEKAGITKTFDLDATAPEASSLVSVTKIASSLDNTPRNATYTYVTAPKMNQVGTQTVKVRVKYEDDSYDDVDVQIVIKEKAPVATGGTFIVYRGEVYRNITNERGAFLTITHGTHPVTGINPRSNPAYPPGQALTGDASNASVGQRLGTATNTTAYLIGNQSSRVRLGAPLSVTTYKYTGRIGGSAGFPYIYSNEAEVIIDVRPQTQAYTASEKAGIRKTLDLNSTAPAPETLVSVVKDVSTLPNTPTNATYTYVTAPKMDQVGEQTVIVKVVYEDLSDDTVSIIINIQNSICTKPANTTGTALNTIVGITDLGRAEGNGNLNDDTSWPMMRKGGWLALESNDKGLVVTRMTTTQITAISAPQEGMIVYDTDAKCLKLYDGTKWSCFSQPVCPKF